LVAIAAALPPSPLSTTIALLQIPHSGKILLDFLSLKQFYSQSSSP
jgi:hypothetical protein